MSFLGPIFVVKMIVVSRKSDPIDVKDMKTRIGGLYLGSGSNILSKTGKVVYSSSVDSLLKMIKHKRVDYTLLPQKMLEGKNMNAYSLKLVTSQEVYIGISKRSGLKVPLKK